MPEYVTTIMVRQEGMSHDVALERALDATQALIASGYNAKLGPTLIAGLVDGVGKRSADWDDDLSNNTEDDDDE